MSYYIDIKYVSLISSRLRNFKRQDEGTYKFSCPVCGDSKKHATKARGYLYTMKGALLYKCHNCYAGLSFANLLKHVDQMVYADYNLDKFKERSYITNPPVFDFTNSTPKFSIPILKSPLDDLKKISDLKDTHPAVQYVINRMIPRRHWNLLYFAPRYIEWCKKYSDKVIPIKEDAPRLVIPTFDAKGVIQGWNGRAFGNEYLRYHIVKLVEDTQLVFGLERVNTNRIIKVVEGAIDSLFIDNCVAMGGISSFDSAFTKEYKENIVLIPDNEPRNLQIVKAIERYIDQGFSICLFPENLSGKDINEIIKHGKTKEELKQIIIDNTVYGASAKMKFSTWRKV